MTAWGTLAIYYSNLPSVSLRTGLSLTFAVCAVVGLLFLRPRRYAVWGFLVVFTGVLLWWLSIPASHDRDWQPDVAVLPSATFAGDLVPIHNIRNNEYRAWYGSLWQSVATALDLPSSVTQAQTTGPRFSVALINKQAANPIIRSYSAAAMTVRVNRELQHRDGERPSARSTRHLEIALPAGATYKTGDHLGIVPRNGLDQLRRVLLRFKLDASLYLTITPHTHVSSYLPVHEPVPLLGVLAT